VCGTRPIRIKPVEGAASLVDALSDDASIFTSFKDVLTLAKTEIERSKRRSQISTAEINGFPIWDIALFLFVALYEDRRVTGPNISSEIDRSVDFTMRLLRLMEAEGIVRFDKGGASPDLGVAISAKTHEAIIEYLTT